MTATINPGTIVDWYRQGRYQQVVEAVQGLITSGQLPSPDMLELAGLAALKQGQPDKAGEFFKALTTQRTQPRDQYHLGTALVQQGRWQQAVECFVRAKQDEKLSMPAELARAECLWRLGRPREALEIMERLDTGNMPAARVLLLNLYLACNEARQARAVLDSLPDALRQQDPVRLAEAQWLYVMRQYDAALELIERNWPDAGNRPRQAANLTAACWLKKGELDLAIDGYRQLLRRYPASRQQQHNLAAALSNHTDPVCLQEAVSLCDALLEQDSTDRQIRHTRALCLRKLGELPAAAVELEKLVDETAGSVDNRHLEDLATTLSDLGRHDQALSVFGRMRPPLSGTNRRQHGIVLARSGNFQAAEAVLLDALAEDERDQRTIAYLALTRLALGKHELVEEFLGLGKLVQQFWLQPEGPWPDLVSFNRELAENIRQHSRLRLNPRGLAARNGYLTSELLADRTPAILAYEKALRQAIDAYIRQLPDDNQHPMLKHKAAVLEQGYTLNLWATWVKGDGFIDKHIHEESWISGAYYVTVPEIVETTGQNAGFFEYGCVPDDLAIPNREHRGFIRPAVGQLVVFPSYLYHQTIPHQTDDDRISIAFDLTPNSWAWQ